MTDKQKNFLREIICRDVFNKSSDVRIVETGIKDASWIMDFRKVILQPEVLSTVSQLVIESMGEEPFQVGGLEVAAIPIVSGVIMKSYEKGRSVSGFFIRKSRKKTGLLNMIEGVVHDERIVLVDDILNSGGSFMRQIEVLELLGKKVDTIFVMLRFRDEAYYEQFHSRGIRVVSLFCLDDFSDVLPVKNSTQKYTAPVPYPFTVLWKAEGKNAHFEHVVPKSSPVLSEGVLYWGTDSGNFYAVDATTSTLRWSFKVPFGVDGKLIFSTPCVLDGCVYFGAYNGNFYCLDKITGTVKWTSFDADWIGSSPCAAKDMGLIYVGMEFGFWRAKGGVAAFDVRTGKRVWQSLSGEYTHGSPVYSKKNKMVVCGSNDGLVYGFHSRTGKIVWSYNAGAEVKAGCSLSPKEKYVAFGSFGKEFVVLEIKTGKKIATIETLEVNYSTPCWVDEDIIICTSLDKRVYAFSMKKGVVLWTFVTTARIFASPVVYGGYVFIGNNSACLYVLGVHDGKQYALFQATERITNAVLIDNEHEVLYLRTFADDLYALSMKAFNKSESAHVYLSNEKK